MRQLFPQIPSIVATHIERTIMKTLKDIINAENQVAQMISELVSKVAADTREAKIDGVQQVSNNAVIVNFSRLDAWIVDPAYYIQAKQADVVEQKLRTAKTATEFMNKLREMVDQKCVKLGRDKVRLNPTTLDILNTYLKQS